MQAMHLHVCCMCKKLRRHAALKSIAFTLCHILNYLSHTYYSAKVEVLLNHHNQTKKIDHNNHQKCKTRATRVVDG